MLDSRSAKSVSQAEVDWDELWQLLRTMLTARAVDEVEAELVRSGEAYFHVACSGHEAMAALAPHLTRDDWLHLHYRDKALLLARGMPVEMFFHSLLCNAASHSAGRQMSAHLSDPARRILSMVGPVGNNALQAVGVAAAIRGQSNRPIVICSVGDGTTQQGEFLEAVAEAVRSQLSVLFCVEDNGYSISTTTAGKTFFSLPSGQEQPCQLFGMPLHRVDGRDAVECLAAFGLLVAQVRGSRRPALVVLDMDRLSSHTNSDDQRAYRDAEQLARIERTGDPIARLAEHLRSCGATQPEIDALEAEVQADVRRAASAALHVGPPVATLVASRPLPMRVAPGAREYRGDPSRAQWTMLEALRETLRRQMSASEAVTLLGEDIEDPKGDVFGVTRGLSDEFPGRVVNSALSESTIVGASIGRALAGLRPVAFIQFADFLPLAFNQIISELGSMHWRSDGAWQCPVIVMIACGGYRPGLGPFHAQTLESIAAHVPGIDVLMPSTAGDAAGLLNAAFESCRPTLFFYPKACLNDRAVATSPDVERQLVPIGAARLVTRGSDLTIVTWGSTVSICRRAVAELENAGVTCDLIDLRSIAPWDSRAVIESATRTGKLLIVHEDNLTCGFGAEVAATVAEAASEPLVVRRVARPDTYVPCNFNNQLEVLPSLKRVLSVAAEVLNLEITWKQPPQGAGGLAQIEAIGSSPADQAVKVIAWKVQSGQEVSAGQPLAEMEADKAVYEMDSPVAGILRELLVPEGQSVPVGTILARIETETNGRPEHLRQASREQPGEPVLKRRGLLAPRRSPVADERQPRQLVVGISTVYSAEGSLVVANEDLVRSFPHRSADEILRLTGIADRRRIAPDESVLTLATTAARRALIGENLSLADLNAIICSTGTPTMITPSLACLVHHQLSLTHGPHDIPAYDILAACTGYLYGLAAGYDFLRAHPAASVLVLTAEAMSTVINPRDFDTAVLFGDAATATVLYGPRATARGRAVLHPPLVSARGENGSAIRLGAPGCGYVEMDGRRVFSEAVRQMVSMLERACAESGISVDDLDLIVPHQANGRIIEAVRSRLNGRGDRVVNEIRQCGNTSSSSIPLCLASVLERQPPGRRIGLCAFGGGYTFGAAVLEVCAAEGQSRGDS